MQIWQPQLTLKKKKNQSKQLSQQMLMNAIRPDGVWTVSLPAESITPRRTVWAT